MARTKSLAVRVISFVENLDRSTSSEIMGKQLIRSATSVAANYRAACRSRSKADFVNKLGIVEEEADETVFWIEMLVECKKANPERVEGLIDETGQILRIISASRITARMRMKTTKPNHRAPN